MLEPSLSKTDKPKRGRGRPPGKKNNPKKLPLDDNPCKPSKPKVNNSGSGGGKGENADTRTDHETVSLNMSNVVYDTVSGESTVELRGITSNDKPEIFETVAQNGVGMQEIGEGLGERPPVIGKSIQNGDVGMRHPQGQRNLPFQQTQFKTEQYNRSKPDEDVSRAMDLVTSIKNSTANEPHLYQLFLDLLDKYRLKQIDMANLELQLFEKFSSYPELLVRFKPYLSEETLPTVNGSDQSSSNLSCFSSAEKMKSLESNSIVRTSERLMEGNVARCPQMMHGNSPMPNMLGNHEVLRLPRVTSDSIKVLRPNDVYEAQSLDDMTLIAIKLHTILQNRLSKDPERYQTVKSALSQLYEMSENLHSDTGNTLVTYAPPDQRIQAYAVICDNLRDEPDLLNVLNAFFSCQRTFEGLPSIGATRQSLTCTERLANNFEGSVSGQFQTSFSSDTIDLQAMVTPKPHSVTLDSILTDKFAVLNDALIAALAEQKVSMGLSIEDYSISTEEKVRRVLQLQYDEERWITELVQALGPILLRISSLRDFIINNLRIVLFKYDKREESQKVGDPIKTASPSVSGQCDSGDIEGINFLTESTSYSVHPDTYIPPKCSGRTDLCNEVLNDKYFSVSSHTKFRQHLRTKEESRMEDFEDARYEVDILLHRGAGTIEVLENLKQKMSGMTQVELDNFQLDDNLSGSSVMHKRIIQLLYKDDGKRVIGWLQKFPSLFLPGVLKILKVRDKEWIELRARWNSVISADLKKFKDNSNRKKRIQNVGYVPERFKSYRRTDNNVTLPN